MNLVQNTVATIFIHWTYVQRLLVFYILSHKGKWDSTNYQEVTVIYVVFPHLCFCLFTAQYCQSLLYSIDRPSIPQDAVNRELQLNEMEERKSKDPHVVYSLNLY